VLIAKALGIPRAALRRTPQVARCRANSSRQSQVKMPDLTAGDLDAAVRTIAGNARSMGVDVEGV